MIGRMGCLGKLPILFCLRHNAVVKGGKRLQERARREIRPCPQWPFRVCRLIPLQPSLLNDRIKELLQLGWGEYGCELGTQTERTIRPLGVIPDPKNVSSIVLVHRKTGLQSDELNKVFLFSVRYGNLIFDQAHPEGHACVLIPYGYGFSDTCYVFKVLIRHCVPAKIAPAPAFRWGLAAENLSTEPYAAKLSFSTTFLLDSAGRFARRSLITHGLANRKYSVGPNDRRILSDAAAATSPILHFSSYDSTDG